VELIGGADIYITPYRHKGQVVFRNACLCLDAGKAIISTPYCTRLSYWTINAACLFPSDDPRAICRKKRSSYWTMATARHAMRKRAYL